MPANTQFIKHERHTHSSHLKCMNTLRSAEETWAEGGKDGRPTPMKTEQAWMAYTLLLHLMMMIIMIIMTMILCIP